MRRFIAPWRHKWALEHIHLLWLFVCMSLPLCPSLIIRQSLLSCLCLTASVPLSFFPSSFLSRRMSPALAGSSDCSAAVGNFIFTPEKSSDPKRFSLAIIFAPVFYTPVHMNKAEPWNWLRQTSRLTRLLQLQWFRACWWYLDWLWSKAADFGPFGLYDPCCRVYGKTLNATSACAQQEILWHDPCSTGISSLRHWYVTQQVMLLVGLSAATESLRFKKKSIYIVKPHKARGQSLFC